MIVEITGGGFANKGAHLMLIAACEKVREAFPGAVLTMPLHHDIHFSQRAGLGLHLTHRRPDTLGTVRRLGQDAVSYVVGQTPLAKMFGFVREDDVDAVVDVSGYGFGDKWPLESTVDVFTRRAARYKRRGVPIVMLPQMLGPFQRPGYAKAFHAMAGLVDRVYARDQRSLEVAEPLVSRAVLRRAPDITIGLIPTSGPPEGGERYACVVPNYRMLEPEIRKAWGGTYLATLETACRHLAAAGLHVRILQHEYYPREATLVEQLAGALQDISVEIIRDEDPLTLKRVLGGAQLVIGSRFHSLVSSLSMGVPVIALGWAHKYEMLLSDFGLNGGIYDGKSMPVLLEKIDDALDRRASLHVELTTRAQQFKAQLAEMWADVADVIGRRPAA